MGLLSVAITQMASENDWSKNCNKAERLVRDAAAKGAKLILLQELFDGDYFCIEQHIRFFDQAHELDQHPTVKRFAALAKELGVVLPVSVFERAGVAHYNTTVIVDADGRQLGFYRKTHIPDGRGYQEKFYFSPGDTGFKVYAGGKLNEVFGLEVGYTDFGKIRASGGDTNAWAFPITLTAGTPLGARFGIFGKVGGLYGRTDVTADPDTLFDRGRKNGWGFTYGAGVTFALTQSLQLRADVDRYKLDFVGGRKDVDMVSAGLQLRF